MIDVPLQREAPIYHDRAAARAARACEDRALIRGGVLRAGAPATGACAGAGGGRAGGAAPRLRPFADADRRMLLPLAAILGRPGLLPLDPEIVSYRLVGGGAGAEFDVYLRRGAFEASRARLGPLGHMLEVVLALAAVRELRPGQLLEAPSARGRWFGPRDLGFGADGTDTRRADAALRDHGRRFHSYAALREAVAGWLAAGRNRPPAASALAPLPAPPLLPPPMSLPPPALPLPQSVARPRPRRRMVLPVSTATTASDGAACTAAKDEVVSGKQAMEGVEEEREPEQALVVADAPTMVMAKDDDEAAMEECAEAMAAEEEAQHKEQHQHKEQQEEPEHDMHNDHRHHHEEEDQRMQLDGAWRSQLHAASMAESGGGRKGSIGGCGGERGERATGADADRGAESATADDMGDDGDSGGDSGDGAAAAPPAGEPPSLEEAMAQIAAQCAAVAVSGGRAGLSAAPRRAKGRIARLVAASPPRAKRSWGTDHDDEAPMSKHVREV